MLTGKFQKLKSGDWGIRVRGAARAGDAVSVVKSSGETSVETVRAVVWSGDGVTLCAIAPRAFSGRSGGYRRSGRGKACVSDGNCSSFGSGKSCGGYDCDGW